MRYLVIPAFGAPYYADDDVKDDKPDVNTPHVFERNTALRRVVCRCGRAKKDVIHSR